MNFIIYYYESTQRSKNAKRFHRQKNNSLLRMPNLMFKTFSDSGYNATL